MVVRHDETTCPHANATKHWEKRGLVQGVPFVSLFVRSFVSPVNVEKRDEEDYHAAHTARQPLDRPTDHRSHHPPPPPHHQTRKNCTVVVCVLSIHGPRGSRSNTSIDYAVSRPLSLFPTKLEPFRGRAGPGRFSFGSVGDWLSRRYGTVRTGRQSLWYTRPALHRCFASFLDKLFSTRPSCCLPYGSSVYRGGGSSSGEPEV